MGIILLIQVIIVLLVPMAKYLFPVLLFVLSVLLEPIPMQTKMPVQTVPLIPYQLLVFLLVLYVQQAHSLL